MLMVNNRAILDGFRRGDQDALVTVYRHYAPAVAQLLRRGFSFSSGGRPCRFHGTPSTFDLEDRMQEVFARAMTERSRLAYDGLSSYEAYLLGIAKNLVIDDFRKKERALVEYSFETQPPRTIDRPVAASEPLMGQLGLSGDPHDDLGAAEVLGLVESFARDLPAREQLVYRLRFVDELQHEDIAAKTGLSPSKIKTSEQKIRTRFFRHMQQAGYFTGYVQRPRGWLSWVRSLGGQTR